MHQEAMADVILRNVEETLQEVKAHFDSGRAEAAQTGGWQLLDAAPDNQRAKLLAIEILSDQPQLATPDRKDLLQRLLNDPAVDPRAIAPAGWQTLRETTPVSQPEAGRAGLRPTTWPKICCTNLPR
jgi:hypothetical protein